MGGATGGQPPFDHRKIPETPDDIESTGGQVGCLVVLALIIGISMLLFLAGVRP
jgi:hypothetical protein